ncbi:hypothetical protein Acr_00g0054240 [Actinidia rufa]|uniref:Uncharacterized protein n=1 Tax=Actinidia rufa TaxID=165716 RepID=A0A7J0DLK9_9ERIC|nr:hypothetical protein Acr_00g0054240 [Actinidia rufa]
MYNRSQPPSGGGACRHIVLLKPILASVPVPAQYPFPCKYMYNNNAASLIQPQQLLGNSWQEYDSEYGMIMNPYSYHDDDDRLKKKMRVIKLIEYGDVEPPPPLNNIGGSGGDGGGMSSNIDRGCPINKRKREDMEDTHHNHIDLDLKL